MMKKVRLRESKTKMATKVIDYKNQITCHFQVNHLLNYKMKKATQGKDSNEQRNMTDPECDESDIITSGQNSQNGQENEDMLSITKFT